MTSTATVTRTALAQQGAASLYPAGVRFAVGAATCGLSAGAAAVMATLERECQEAGLEATVVPVGCRGLCWAEPLIEVLVLGHGRVVYGRVSEEDAANLVAAVARGELDHPRRLGARAVEDYTLTGGTRPLGDIGTATPITATDFVAGQTRIVLGNCGLIDPGSLPEYCAVGGFEALAAALDRPHREQIIEEISQARLRGRGGAGYPTAEKWRAVAAAPDTTKYLVINADEGDPGAYMDRGLIEGDPFRIIEGALIAAYAVGAGQGYVFIRSEYPLASQTLQRAIDACRHAGLLGPDILGRGFSFDLTVVRSAGAYVCGEETALIAALENRPPEPRVRPPYPSEDGLWRQPTLVNNVETLANVPAIINRGAAWFANLGSLESGGTKMFSLVGAVERAGLVEVAMGTPMRTVIETIGGARDTKAIQIGGPSGAILPPAIFDLPLDYDSLQRVGGTMGSGGVVLLSAEQCVVDTVAFLVGFSAEESCGLCVPCRDGLARCWTLLEQVRVGTGSPADLEELKTLCGYIAENSLCALGRLAVRCVGTALTYFEDEFQAHLDGRCPSLSCRELIRFEIIQDKCQGERCCLQTCPGNAIRGRFGKPGHIVDRLCSQCWMCMSTCPYSAIQVVTGRK